MSQSSATSSPGGRGGPTVLLIDDDEVGRTLLRESLGSVSKRIIELSSPIGATRVVGHEQVDVVVLDVEMPNLRGDALAKLFRNNPRIGHVGVILVSGCRSDELEVLGDSCGADGVVSKRHVRGSLAVAVHSAWLASRARLQQVTDKSATDRRAGEDPRDDGAAPARPGSSAGNGR